jgi:rhamnosyltransferase
LGPFRDDLFIDQVDHEYCLRAHRNGYDVVQVGDAVIEHTLGDRTVHSVGGLPVVTSNHSALRRYYITRNRLMVARQYPDLPTYRRLQRWQTFSELRNIVLFEDGRRAKLAMMARGVWDYARHRAGPLPESQSQGLGYDSPRPIIREDDDQT